VTKILTREMGINVVWAGTYCKYDKSWFEKEVGDLCDEIKKKLVIYVMKLL